MRVAGTDTTATATTAATASPTGEKAKGGYPGGAGGCSRPTMNRTWAARNADSPPTKRSRGSISSTSPAREQATAATNHHRRCTRSVWSAGRAAAARVRATRTAGLAAYSVRRSPRDTATQSTAAATAATPNRIQKAVTPPTLAVGSSARVEHPPQRKFVVSSVLPGN